MFNYKYNMYKILLVGCGYWGKNYIRVLNELNNMFKLIGIIEIDNDMIKSLKHSYPNLHITSNIDDIIDQVECVIIAAPISKHFTIAKYCIEKNKHILIEKPFTSSSILSQQLISLANSNTIIIGYTMPYIEGFSYMKQYLKENTSNIKYIYAKRTNFGIIRTDCNVIYDLSCHDIAGILYLLEEMPIWVNANATGYISKDNCDIAFITMGFKNDVVFNLYTSWIDCKKQREFTVITDKFRISFNDNKESPIEIINSKISNDILYSDQIINQPYILWKEPLKSECTEFYNSIKNSNSPLTNTNFSLNVDIILEKIMESIKLEKKIYLSNI